MNSDHRAALSRVIVFLNDKGGVFKTSIVANVGGLLAAAGYRVLLIDLDPQGNLATDLGYTEQSDQGEGLFMALRHNSKTPLSPLAGIRENLSVLPGGPNLTDLAKLLELDQSSNRRDANLALAEKLAPIAGDYDFIFVDTPPKVLPLQSIALGAARWLVIPTKPDSASTEGLSHVTDLFTQAVGYNQDLEFLGVELVGISTSATAIRREARGKLVDAFGSESFIFDSIIRTAEKPAYMSREHGRLVHEMEASSAAKDMTASGLASDYQALAVEIAARISDAETSESDEHAEVE